jgi:hypothetical protein
VIFARLESSDGPQRPHIREGAIRAGQGRPSYLRGEVSAYPARLGGGGAPVTLVPPIKTRKCETGATGGAGGPGGREEELEKCKGREWHRVRGSGPREADGLDKE